MYVYICMYINIIVYKHIHANVDIMNNKYVII